MYFSYYFSVIISSFLVVFFVHGCHTLALNFLQPDDDIWTGRVFRGACAVPCNKTSCHSVNADHMLTGQVYGLITKHYTFLEILLSVQNVNM